MHRYFHRGLYTPFGLAQRGKSSTGWFFGFKLHILVNHQGELLDIKVTSGNVDDCAALHSPSHNPFDTAILNKHNLIETLFDQLKHQSQIQHSRHRSVFNFAVNLLAGIIAYSLQPAKPSISLSSNS